MNTNFEQTTKKRKKRTPYPMTSTTSRSSESSSKTKEMGSHSLSLAMILTCCRPCLSNVYLNSLEKKEKNRRAKNREKRQKNVFQIVRSLSWERQHLLQHCLNTLQKNHIMFQFLFLQLGQKLLHQTKRNKQIVKHRLPSKEDVSSSAMPNPKVHDKRQSEKHLVLVFSHTQNCR